MNQCSGNGICGSNGQCSCAAGWKGADCSLASTSLTHGLRKSEAHTGPKYFSFTKQGGDASSLRLKSDVPMDVYVTGCAHADPNQFQNQLLFKQTKRVTLNSHDFENLDSERGYTVTVYVPAIDENANKLLNNTLSVGFELRGAGIEAIEEVIPVIVDTMMSAEDAVSKFETIFAEDVLTAVDDVWTKFSDSFLQN